MRPAVSRPLSSPLGVAVGPDIVARFRETAFVLGPFPVLSQTFIYRELEAMTALGLEVNVVSTGRRSVGSLKLSPALQAIARRALHFEHGSISVLASSGLQLRYAAVRDVMQWMMGFPHRTAATRARAAAAVLVAAHFAPELQKRGIRYVHSHFAGFQTEVAMALARLLGVPYGCTWHSYGIYKDRNILHEKIEGARVILTCTRHNAAHLRALTPEHADRIRLAYHGLPVPSLPEPPRIAQTDTPVILAVGRMVPTKGFPYLIRAAQLLKKRGRSFELRFIGDGPERRELRALVSVLGLDGNVRFLGARPNAEVFHELIGAQVVVVPSARTPDGDMDGLPNVVLEAMSMARPVVGSRLSGIPEAVTHGETGLLAEPGNPADLARQIEILFDDPGLARRLGRQARERIPATFDVNQNVHQVIRLIARAK